MDREYFNCGELKCYRDWDCEGSICMENPKTIDRYHEITKEQYDFEKNGIFFAFGQEQFEEEKAKMIKKGYLKEEDKLYAYGAGAVGKKEGWDKFLHYADEKKKRIAQECDPQEVYFYEYNNHECMFADDSDAYALVEDIFGEERASQIQRF